MKGKLCFCLLIILGLTQQSIAQTALDIFPDTLSTCNNPPLTLDAGKHFSDSAVSYLWSSGDTTQLLNVFSKGIYSVTVTGDSSGYIYSDTVEIIEQDSPIVEFSRLIDTIDHFGTSVVISLDPLLPNTYKYTWIDPVDTTHYPYYIAVPQLLGVGLSDVNVNVEDHYGCTGTQIHQIRVCGFHDCDPVGLKDENAAELGGNLISLSPNPNNGQFSIQIEGINSNSHLSIYNSIGQVVYQKRFHQSQKLFRRNINLNPESGVYFVRLKTNGLTYYQKLICTTSY